MLGIWILLAAAEAATLTVGPAADFADVVSALDAAEADDVISIAGGEYRGALVVTVDVTLEATDPADPPVLTARDADVITVRGSALTMQSIALAPDSVRGLNAEAGSTVILREVSVEGAEVDINGGGIRVIDASLLVEDSTFAGNTAETAAGGHIWATRTDLTIRRSTFSEGDASFGGAIRVEGSTVVVEDSDFDENSVASDGGALYSLSSDVTISGSTFTNNTTRPDQCDDSCEGGAVRFGDGSTWTIADSVFDRNITAGDVGGAVVSTARSSGTVSGSTFTRNEGNFGGAIYLGSEGSVTIEGSTFETNRAYDGEGGAIRWRPDAAEPTLLVRGSTFVDNTATDRGGALGLNTTNGPRGTLVLEDNRFETNASATAGGALSVEATSNLSGIRNLFCGNTADTAGGGVRIISGGFGSSTWRNNLFIENESGDYGGGIHLSSAGPTEFVNNHVLGNGSDEGGGVRAFETSLVFTNNLVGWSTSGTGVSSNTAIDGGIDYSALFSNEPADLGGDLSPDTLGDGMVEGDPMLREYTRGGGCDQAVYPDLGSPLIDGGDPGIVDPDGTTSDIGAYGGPDAPEGAIVDDDGDGFVALEDCDDNDPTIFPGADEICDGIDQDCDGLVDVGAIDGAPFYLDVDRDGQGDPATEVFSCDPPAGHVTSDSDCDDTNASIYAGAPELCDGLDQDCNGEADDGLLETWFADSDGDGYGDPELTEDACREPVGFVADGTDCNDEDANTYPGAPDELGDEVDQDCDGEDGSLATEQGNNKQPGGCGCATSTPAPAGWLLVVGLLGALRRRR